MKEGKVLVEDVELLGRAILFQEFAGDFFLCGEDNAICCEDTDCSACVGDCFHCIFDLVETAFGTEDCCSVVIPSAHGR